MEMMHAAKVGDVSKLQALTQNKREDAKLVLSKIQLYFAQNPAKVMKYGSITEMKLHAAKNSETGNGEVERMERDIHVARVKATISYLRRLVKSEEGNERKVVVASTDPSVANHMIAVLTAAALCTWDLNGSPRDGNCEIRSASVKLLLGRAEHAMGSFDDFLRALDRVLFDKLDVDDAPSFVTTDGNSTTKAVMNLLDRHVAGDGVAALLVGSQDLSLPHDMLEDLLKRNCKIHCHDADDMGQRLLREKAKKGDVTISLAWDTEDDLDLHVFVPGGEEICYSNVSSRDGLCHLDVDMNAAFPFSQEPVENVFCGPMDQKKQAPMGLYKVVVENYGFHTSGPRSRKIPFRITVERNGQKHKYEGETMGGSGKESRAVVCDFEYQGRTIPFPSDSEIPLSAFGTSNLLNVTSSSGQTLEALSHFVEVIEHLEKLEEAKEWLAEDDATTTVVTALTAEGGELNVTNYDRLQILLAKLPARFHFVADEAFGRAKLWDHCGKIIGASDAERSRPPIKNIGDGMARRDSHSCS